MERRLSRLAVQESPPTGQENTPLGAAWYPVGEMKRPNWYEPHPLACTCAQCTARPISDWASRRPVQPVRRRRRRRRIKVSWIFVGIAVAIVGYLVWSDTGGTGDLWTNATDGVSEVVSFDTGGAQETANSLWSSASDKVAEVVSFDTLEPLDMPAVRSWVIHYTNQERSDAGLHQVEHDPRISAIAEGHSKYMAQYRYSHNSILGDATGRARTANYPCYGLSENIFEYPLASLREKAPTDFDSTSQRLAWALVDGWMGSSGHRANILDPQARKIGFGMAIGETIQHGVTWETAYATQNFAPCP